MDLELKTMKIKIKKLSPGAVIPSYSKDGDAGLDLTATREFEDDNYNICYGTGLSIEIPKGYVGLIFPRSSISNKDLTLTNSVCVIDSRYREEIIFKFKPTYDYAIDSYVVGDRIGQLIIMPYPHIEFEEVEELSETERGAGGFGSTGL